MKRRVVVAMVMLACTGSIWSRPGAPILSRPSVVLVSLDGFLAPPFRNVHVYDLIAGILGLAPAPNDGSQDSTMALLR